MHDRRPFAKSGAGQIAFQHRDRQRVRFNQRKLCVAAPEATLEEEIGENAEVTATGPAVHDAAWRCGKRR